MLQFFLNRVWVLWRDILFLDILFFSTKIQSYLELAFHIQEKSGKSFLLPPFLLLCLIADLSARSSEILSDEHSARLF